MVYTTTAFSDKDTTIPSINTKVTKLLTTSKATVVAIGRTATTKSLNTTSAILTKKHLKTIAIDKAEHVTSGL